MKLLKGVFLMLPILFLALSCSDDDEPETFILSVTISPQEGGSVSPDGGAFEDGTVVTLTAIPSEGYTFSAWTGDLNSTENPVSIAMDSDMGVTLVFTASDADNDGVSDIADQCPDTPEGETVDAEGCSESQKDTDGDGVTDDLDTCPDTPEGAAVNQEGCAASQTDTDGDGVFDNTDICPDTPQDAEVDEDGCPLASAVYLDENGLTVKAYEWSLPGQTGTIDGVVYTVVSEGMLREMVDNGEDVTRVCTSKVTDMSALFFLDSSFNQDIGSWDVSQVTDMSRMFVGDIMSGFRHPFNQDISLWDVSRVTDMSAMFSYSAFDKPIGNWDVSSVTTMNNMFTFSNFNQPIGAWDVSQVTDMSTMFLYATAFNQDLGAWDVDQVTLCEGFSENTPQWTLPKPNFTNCDPN